MNSKVSMIGRRTKFAAFFFTCLVIPMANHITRADDADGPPPFVPAVKGFDYDLRDHGIPVQCGSFQRMVTATDPEDNREKIYGAFVDNEGFILVEMDALTGKCRQYEANNCSAPWGMAVTPENDLLISTNSGEIFRFDARQNQLRLAAKTDECLYAMERAGDGSYYLGSYPHAWLYRFNPASNELVRVKQLDAEQKYLHDIVANDDGYLYGTTGPLHAQVIAYEQATGEFHELLPPSEAPAGFVVRIIRAADGFVYIKGKTGAYFRLRNGQAERLEGERAVAAEQELRNFWVPRLRDGSRLTYQDADTVVMEGPSGTKRLKFDYHSRGTTIFTLRNGPDGIYGGTILPLYLFRFKPDKNRMENLGRGARDNGEIYSLAQCQGEVFYGTYPTGLLMRYDPKKSWDAVENWDRNPRQIAELGLGHGRPRVMEVDSRKRLWIGGLPAYGAFDGGLACYDVRQDTIERFLPVIPNQSIFSIGPAPDGKTIYCGTTIERGSGTNPSEKQALLFAWNVEQKKVAWQLAPISSSTCISNLIYQKGKLYGTSEPDGVFFVFDLATKTIVKSTPSWFGWPRQQSMTLGPDGNIYGITWMSLFRFRPDGRVEELERYHGVKAIPYGGSLFHGSAAIRDGRLYFSWKTHIMSVKLPLEAH